MKDCHWMRRVCWLLLPCPVLLASCGGPRAAPVANSPSVATKMTLNSPEFVDGAQLPLEYTCDGKNVSPHVRWLGAPRRTAAFVLIGEDPDAPGGTWTHWVLYNLPARATQLHANVPGQPVLPDGAMQGVNDFKKIGYGGACPPAGPAHRYVFKVFALDQKLVLPPAANKQQVLNAMQGHALAEGQLMGKYARQ